MIATVTQSSLGEEDNIEQFAVELNQLIENCGCHWLALDLSQVKLITSSAIGKLIALHRNLHRREGCLALCGVVGFVQGVLQTANLIDYFHIQPSVDEAVEMLKQVKSSPAPPFCQSG